VKRRTAIVVFSLAATAAALPAPASAHGTRRFVTRDGSRLTLGGRPFRFAGTNLYWLGLDENVGGIDYPTYFRIRDALDTAKAMGLTVVRSHMLTSTGHAKTLLPSKEAGYNDEAFRTVDYAIAHAGTIGIRLIVPLTDNWAYYHGGHADFTKPYGLPDAAFYTDPRVIADYQAYVKHVMDHVNPHTGKRYVDDPTIMAWELGNELEGMTPEWINANAAVFSAWAPRQLIAAGRRFDIDPDTLNASDVDIVDVHYYPPTAAKVRADAATVAAAGKVYIAGEYASNAATSELLTPLITDRNVAGMLSWSLFGHGDRSGFVAHDDGFTFHHPGDDARMTTANQAQIAYATALGASIARRPTGIPLITEIGKRGGLNVVQWRGAAGAVGYRVERARAARGPWKAAHTALLTDNDTPWTDPTPPGDVWYRVVPIGGIPSEPVFAGRRQIVVTDPLETFALTAGHTNAEIRPGAGHAVVRPAAGGAASISWCLPGIRAVRFEALSPELTVQVSADGMAWRAIRTRTFRDGHWTITADTSDVDHVRIVWRGRRTGIRQATLWAADPAPVDGAPAAFATQTPAAGATGVIGPSTFTWASAAGAGYYTLIVSAKADLSDPVLTATGLSTTTFTTTEDLNPATTFFWAVRATNADGATSTPVATFTTRAVPTAPTVIDDYSGYADSAALGAAYVRNPGGDLITPSLVAGAMQLDVTAGASGYAGVTRTFTTPLDLWGHQGIELLLDRSGTQSTVTVQFVADGAYREHTLPAGTPSGVVRIPFTAFAPPPWAGSGVLNLQKFSQLSFYLGGNTSGRLLVDSVQAYPAS
jgi:mannan endo-1,4-beta-mannosidase